MADSHNSAEQRLYPIATAIFIGFMLLHFSTSGLGAETKNGFNLADALIPADEILSGGPPRDGIPAISDPKFITAADANYMADSDRVLGIFRGGVAKAYPIAILNWHEIVNDRINGEPVAITFCPLCGTGMAFKAKIDNKPCTFGVSGLLYNSDVLLYDRETESLWSQIARKAVSGPQKGKRLDMVPVAHTTWGDWRNTHPDTLVLSRETGHGRNYDRNPYAGYEKSDGVFFPVSKMDRRYHPKEQVIGLEVDGNFKAYPFTELSRTEGSITDKVAGQTFIVEYDHEHQTGRVLDGDGATVPTVIAFWFAWAAFHPETAVFEAP